MRRTPSKDQGRPITHHQSAKTPQARPETVFSLTPNHQGTAEITENTPKNDRFAAKSPTLRPVNRSPDHSHQQKYAIENHSYLGIQGASLFSGVLQRDEASLLKAKRFRMQQEVKTALQLQIQEKRMRIEAERCLPISLKGQKPQVNELPQCEKLQPAESPEAHIGLLLCQELISEHEKLEAKVAAQGAWIRHLVDKSCREVQSKGLNANPRRTRSSAVGILPEQMPRGKGLELRVMLDDSQDETTPVTSFATPVHKYAGEKRGFEAELMLLGPGRKSSFQHSKPWRLTPDPLGRRETSEPRQRRTPTPNLRFPKDVFPMAVRRRPAVV
jgi:hypothetical protein